ncbi:MAG: hypothetical protein OEV06_10275, partial [Anaerolineae bacterium]|nr:hypothetical protein [Anaerolineae bacterium]
MSENKEFSSQDMVKLREYLKKNLAYEIEENPPKPDQYRQTLEKRLDSAFEKTMVNLDGSKREKLFAQVIDDLVGYGPIQP